MLSAFWSRAWAFCPGWFYQDHPRVSTWNDQLYKPGSVIQIWIGWSVIQTWIGWMYFLPCPQSGAGFYIAWVSYTVAVCDCVFHLYDFLHSRSLRLCISSVRFLTQSQSATVYFICMISFFLLLLTQSQSATVYFICMISYTVAVCDCVFLLYDFFFFFFFLLSTFLWLISRTWLDWF